jgi:hypothetical protein
MSTYVHNVDKLCYLNLFKIQFAPTSVYVQALSKNSAHLERFDNQEGLAAFEFYMETDYGRKWS